MPIFKTIKVSNQTRILIWKITETIEELKTGISLTKKNNLRFEGMRSELHQKGFLSIRHLLKNVGYNDEDVIYDEYGKPHLKDGKFISITHSFNFTGIIVSDDVPVGIDIEKQRKKIIKIGHKFTPLSEYKDLNDSDLIRKLTVVWGGKESLYKIYGKKQLHFLDHIYIDNFNLKSEQTTGEIHFEDIRKTFFISFLEFEGFTCVYAF